ncbi:glycosyl transferase [Reichenbachiella agarivorans]|uniref:Glycosyl transferase n=1 Tax=Reichenbachiella agarivorans TaxID=2979464 RepID=A0ABY6CWP5_9BACT|nr:glycosyltransferase family protein [Reichenbachiella agarivorans]UXP32670.1 glycosyl transferase [Reichenbachiella agarivorans]
MKILYAIQGTGNGHLSRALDVIPALSKRVNVDVLISGIQADLSLPFPVKYRYDGMSFIFGKGGGVDIVKTFKNASIRKLMKEIKSCPVEQYDLVINDFEPVSAWACRMKGVKCIALSHQSALRSKLVPKPPHADWFGSQILKNYAPADDYYSFHFRRYDQKIFTPIIRNDIRNQEITDLGHYTVYLPAYGDKKLIKNLSKIKNVQWEVFSKHTLEDYTQDNVHIQRIDGLRFVESMASSAGVLCGAGFETPAEAMYLTKKLLVVPMKRQYEQHFNAESLKELGVPVLTKLNKKAKKVIQNWVDHGKEIPVYFPEQTQFIIDKVLQEHISAPEAEPKKPIFSFPRLKFLS